MKKEKSLTYKKFKDMTDEELKDIALGAYNGIYITECFSVSDITNYEGAMNELDRRGYLATETTKLTLAKKPKTEIPEDIEKLKKLGKLYKPF